jgi:hypothetical protein
LLKRKVLTSKTLQQTRQRKTCLTYPQCFLSLSIFK